MYILYDLRFPFGCYKHRGKLNIPCLEYKSGLEPFKLEEPTSWNEYPSANCTESQQNR